MQELHMCAHPENLLIQRVHCVQKPLMAACIAVPQERRHSRINICGLLLTRANHRHGHGVALRLAERLVVCCDTIAGRGQHVDVATTCSA